MSSSRSLPRVRTRKARTARLPLAEQKEWDRVREEVRNGLVALKKGWDYEESGEEGAVANSKEVLASDLKQYNRTAFGDKLRAFLQSSRFRGNTLYTHDLMEFADDFKKVALRVVRPRNRLANTLTTRDKQLVDMYLNASASVSGSVSTAKVERLLHMKNIGRNAARAATRRLHRSPSA